MLFYHPDICSGESFSLDLSDERLNFEFSWAGCRKSIFLSGIEIPGWPDDRKLDVNRLRFLRAETCEDTDLILELKNSLLCDPLLFVEILDDGHPFDKIVLKKGESLEDFEDMGLMKYCDVSRIAKRIIFFDLLLGEACDFNQPVYKLWVYGRDIKLFSVPGMNGNRFEMYFNTIREAVVKYNSL